jgi:hypothetical protein
MKVFRERDDKTLISALDGGKQAVSCSDFNPREGISLQPDTGLLFKYFYTGFYELFLVVLSASSH